MKDLSGKVAIITGSSRGIGKALAIGLAKEGVSIVLNGRNEERLMTTLHELKALGYSCLAVAGNISDYSSCKRLIIKTIEHFGKIDILVNNAGLAMEGKIEDTSPEVFQSVFDTNILGVLYPTKAALPFIKEQEGSIVFTGSIAGFMGLPEFSAYSSSKMALTALVQSLRIELAGTNVHVGLNYVGFAENDVNKTYLNQKGEEEIMPVRETFKRMPLDEVARIFVTGIKKRKSRQVLSFLGKSTGFIQRFFPGIFEKIMIRKYLKTTKRPT